MTSTGGIPQIDDAERSNKISFNNPQASNGREIVREQCGSGHDDSWSDVPHVHKGAACRGY